MTAKEEKFIYEYLIDGNASRAYVAAGYSNKTPEKNAYKLLTRPHICEAIKQAQNKTIQKLEITRESILMDLEQLKNNNKDTNPQAAIKALDLQIKMLGFNAPEKTETKITGDLNISKLFGFDEE